MLTRIDAICVRSTYSVSDSNIGGLAPWGEKKDKSLERSRKKSLGDADGVGGRRVKQEGKGKGTGGPVVRV